MRCSRLWDRQVGLFLRNCFLHGRFTRHEADVGLGIIDSDPYRLHRFAHFYEHSFDKAMAELRTAAFSSRRASVKLSFDIRYLFPNTPYITKGRERYDHLALRNSNESCDGDEAVIAFLAFSICVKCKKSIAAPTKHPQACCDTSSVISYRDNYIRAAKQLLLLMDQGYTISEIVGCPYARLVYRSSISFKQVLIQQQKQLTKDNKTSVVENEVLNIVLHLAERMVESAISDQWNDFIEIRD